MQTDARRTIFANCLRILVAAVAAATAASQTARALQQRTSSPFDPAAAIRMVYERRAELTRRSLDELSRREMRKPQPTAAEAAARLGVAAKPGVTRAVTPEERDALAHAEKGLAHFEKGRYEKAVAEFLAAVGVYPAASVVHNNLGSAYFALGRLPEAVNSFKRACELDAGFAKAHFNLGLMYLKQGREQDATSAMDAAARAYLASGDQNLSAGYLEEAEEDFRGLLLIDPEFYPGRLKLGMVHAAARRHKEAAELFRQLTRERPNRPEAHRHLGAALYELGQYNEAAAALQQSITLQPDSTDALYDLGKTHLKLNQPDLALTRARRLRDLGDTTRADTLQQLIDGKHPPTKP